jgi:hypothetical protein
MNHGLLKLKIRSIVAGVFLLNIVETVIIGAISSSVRASANVLPPLTYASEIALFILPLTIVLACISKTRTLGGALLFLSGAVWLMLLWFFSLFLIYQYKGVWWCSLGVALSVPSLGYGMILLLIVICAIGGNFIAAVKFSFVLLGITVTLVAGNKLMIPPVSWYIKKAQQRMKYAN